MTSEEVKVAMAIPGTVPISVFIRRPSDYVCGVANTRQPLLILKNNAVVAAIVPLTEVKGLLAQFGQEAQP